MAFHSPATERWLQTFIPTYIPRQRSLAVALRRGRAAAGLAPASPPCYADVDGPVASFRNVSVLLVPPQVLVQEFLVGTEYVVDTVSRDGEHKVRDLFRPVAQRLYSRNLSAAVSATACFGFAFPLAHPGFGMHSSPRAVKPRHHRSGSRITSLLVAALCDPDNSHRHRSAV